MRNPIHAICCSNSLDLIKFSSLIALSVLLSACSSFNTSPPFAQRVLAISSTITEFSSKGPVTADEQTLDMVNSQLWFPAIAGHIYGTPDIEPKWKPKLDQQSFTISQAQLDAELEKQAKPFDERETSILVAPENTRIARVAPFLLAQFDGEPIGKSNWHNPLTNRDLLLVYFDRPCRILGSMFNEGHEVRFDIEIPDSGLYWLEQRRSWFGPDRYVNGAPPRQTVLAVHKP